MQVFCEKVGILGPVHRLAGQGLSDVEIAKKFGITELKVEGCLDIVFSAFHRADRTATVRITSDNNNLAVYAEP